MGCGCRRCERRGANIMYRVALHHLPNAAIMRRACVRTRVFAAASEGSTSRVRLLLLAKRCEF